MAITTKIKEALTGNDETISKKHAERVAEVTKRRAALDGKREAMLQKHEIEKNKLEAGDGAALAAYEAQVAAFEAKHEETIAAEALATLRAEARRFGDSPRTATIAIRDAWRAYLDRVRDELGSDEPNFALLAAAFVNAECEGAIGVVSFFEHSPVATDLGLAIQALAGESIPRMTLALQNLDVAVDETALRCRAEEEPDAERMRAITTSATHASLARRINLGDRLAGAIGEALHRIAAARSAA